MRLRDGSCLAGPVGNVAWTGSMAILPEGRYDTATTARGAEGWAQGEGLQPGR